MYSRLNLLFSRSRRIQSIAVSNVKQAVTAAMTVKQLPKPTMSRAELYASCELSIPQKRFFAVSSDNSSSLRIHLLNVDKVFNADPIALDINRSSTTIGEFYKFIKDNQKYTEYPHKFPHAIVINGNRIFIDEFMSENPNSNFYNVLLRYGFKPFVENKNEGGVAIVTCTYADIDNFRAQGKIINLPELNVDDLSGASEAVAFMGMHLLYTRANTGLFALSLGEALFEKKKEKEMNEAVKKKPI